MREPPPLAALSASAVEVRWLDTLIHRDPPGAWHRAVDSRTGPKFIPHNTPLAQAKTRTMKTTGPPGRWLIILPPLIFLLIFFLIPFAFAFKISFAESASRVPPFTDVISFTRDHHLQLTLTLGNYRYLLTDEVYGVAYLYSLRTAFFSTLICLALGYPMAYAIARSPQPAVCAGVAAAHNHAAVLDFVPAAGVRAGRDHPRQRLPQHRAAAPGSH